MKNLKISHQLLAMVAVLMVAFAAVTYYQIRSSIASIYAERYDMLRTQVESGISILQSYYDREKSGELKHEDAQKLAYATVAGIKYEPAGYIFGLNYDTVTQFHYNPKVVGLNQKGQPDKMGNLFREELVAKGRAGGGVTTYFWEKPGKPADQVFEKAAYSRAFEPWQIIVATGVYTDDLDVKINKTIMEVLGIGFIAFLLALGVAFIVIRNITKPLAAVHTALQAVADEDVKTQIPHTEMSNEVGMMAKATGALQEKSASAMRWPTARRSRRQSLTANASRTWTCSRRKQHSRPAWSPPSARRWNRSLMATSPSAAAISGRVTRRCATTSTRRLPISKPR